MDPNLILQEIHELRRAVISARNDEEAARAAVKLADRLAELDEWIKGGGFLPRVWQGRPHAGHTLHEIRLVPKPKFGARDAVGAVCRCGYESGANDQYGASKAGAQHLASKWPEVQP